MIRMMFTSDTYFGPKFLDLLYVDFNTVGCTQVFVTYSEGSLPQPKPRCPDECKR